MNRAARLRLPVRLRPAWWLWLALLLPLAQAAATWHAYSHVAAEVAGYELGAASGKATSHGGLCALCLASVALDSGGLPAAAPALPLPALRPALPALVTVAFDGPRPTPAYLSRAPPLPSR